MIEMTPRWFQGTDKEYAALREAEYRRHIEFELARLNQEYGVIKDIRELSGWEIIGLDRYKPGVVRYIAFRKTGTMAEQKIGFAQDEVFAHLQIREPETSNQ